MKADRPAIGDRSLLVIEDDEPLRDALIALLTDAGWIVSWSINGEDALRTFRSDPANVILTDIVMPEMTGLEFIRAIREFDTDTPIVILTGYSTYEYCLDALRAGATDLMTKPFRNDELIRAVNQAFAHRHGLVPPEPTGTLVDHHLTIRIPGSELSGPSADASIAEVLYQIDAVCRQTGFRRRRLAVRRSLQEALLLASGLMGGHGSGSMSSIVVTADFDDKQCRMTLDLPAPCPELGPSVFSDPLSSASAGDNRARRAYLIRSFCDEIALDAAQTGLVMIIHHPRYQRPLRKGA